MKTASEMKMIVKEAKDLLIQLETDHPGLRKKASLVFSNRFGQCDLTDDLASIFREFPRAFEANELFEEVAKLSEQKKQAIDSQKPTTSIDEKLCQALLKLTLANDLRIELRWKPGNLDYAFIQQLIEHPLLQKNQPFSPLAPVILKIGDDSKDLRSA